MISLQTALLFYYSIAHIFSFFHVKYGQNGIVYTPFFSAYILGLLFSRFFAIINYEIF